MKVYGAASLFFLFFKNEVMYHRCVLGSAEIPWGIIELVLWRTALQADTYVFGFIRAHLHFVPMYTGYSW